MDTPGGYLFAGQSVVSDFSTKAEVVRSTGNSIAAIVLNMTATSALIPTFDPSIPPVVEISDGIHYDVSTWAIPTVAVTTTGPICGYCQQRHANVASIRQCHVEGYQGEAQAEADYLHERYCERAWERRFDYYAGSEEEAHDRWLDSFRDA
jgi:hypothetical protein